MMLIETSFTSSCPGGENNSEPGIHALCLGGMLARDLGRDSPTDSQRAGQARWGGWREGFCRELWRHAGVGQGSPGGSLSHADGHAPSTTPQAWHGALLLRAYCKMPTIPNLMRMFAHKGRLAFFLPMSLDQVLFCWLLSHGGASFLSLGVLYALHPFNDWWFSVVLPPKQSPDSLAFGNGQYVLEGHCPGTGRAGSSSLGFLLKSLHPADGKGQITKSQITCTHLRTVLIYTMVGGGGLQAKHHFPLENRWEARASSSVGAWEFPQVC